MAALGTRARAARAYLVHAASDVSCPSPWVPAQRVNKIRPNSFVVQIHNTVAREDWQVMSVMDFQNLFRFRL